MRPKHQTKALGPSVMLSGAKAACLIANCPVLAPQLGLDNVILQADCEEACIKYVKALPGGGAASQASPPDHAGVQLNPASSYTPFKIFMCCLATRVLNPSH